MKKSLLALATLTTLFSCRNSSDKFEENLPGQCNIVPHHYTETLDSARVYAIAPPEGEEQILFLYDNDTIPAENTPQEIKENIIGHVSNDANEQNRNIPYYIDGEIDIQLDYNEKLLIVNNIYPSYCNDIPEENKKSTNDSILGQWEISGLILNDSLMNKPCEVVGETMHISEQSISFYNTTVSQYTSDKNKLKANSEDIHIVTSIANMSLNKKYYLQKASNIFMEFKEDLSLELKFYLKHDRLTIQNQDESAKIIFTRKNEI
ncbi:hypothetical protein [Aureibacter tunicatorum]|uniref:Lipoprotein n=1 Tax=Aureibacter tunicatorum TaxID=866807 RepID=A0AAE3XMX3_9BACT|nr:hypothetical protein [Aureibacter tunicatorum]MDR6240861.1 hypothetical protein [Aureibacter tunicatorum]BDD06805.1 hypothetical protein AUTU_42880 [Aureibacter tunicatorum]